MTFEKNTCNNVYHIVLFVFVWYPLNLLFTILPSFDSLWCPIFYTLKKTLHTPLIKSACWECTGCQFSFSSLVLFFFSAEALEKRRRGGERNPLCEQQLGPGTCFKFGHQRWVFLGPFCNMFYVSPKHWNGACITLHLLYPSRTSHGEAGCQHTLGLLHFLPFTAQVMWLNTALWRIMGRDTTREENR